MFKLPKSLMRSGTAVSPIPDLSTRYISEYDCRKAKRAFGRRPRDHNLEKHGRFIRHSIDTLDSANSARIALKPNDLMETCVSNRHSDRIVIAFPSACRHVCGCLFRRREKKIHQEKSQSGATTILCSNSSLAALSTRTPLRCSLTLDAMLDDPWMLLHFIQRYALLRIDDKELLHVRHPPVEHTSGHLPYGSNSWLPGLRNWGPSSLPWLSFSVS